MSHPPLPSRPRQYDLIVFDWDGTLFDSTALIVRAIPAACRDLGTETLRGFLTGFVDLVAEHDGRYWVLDWKSNHLGDTLEDYHDEALHAAMVHHDYVLQYHLYVLALHRHLRSRLPDYAPERHLGGVCYVFLRGAAQGRTTGMFHDTVPARTVLALDHWLGGGDR